MGDKVGTIANSKSQSDMIDEILGRVSFYRSPQIRNDLEVVPSVCSRTVRIIAERLRSSLKR
jgi:hypothetical protein